MYLVMARCQGQLPSSLEAAAAAAGDPADTAAAAAKAAAGSSGSSGGGGGGLPAGVPLPPAEGDAAAVKAATAPMDTAGDKGGGGVRRVGGEGGERGEGGGAIGCLDKINWLSPAEGDAAAVKAATAPVDTAGKGGGGWKERIVRGFEPGGGGGHDPTGHFCQNRKAHGQKNSF